MSGTVSLPPSATYSSLAYLQRLAIWELEELDYNHHWSDSACAKRIRMLHISRLKAESSMVKSCGWHVLIRQAVQNGEGSLIKSQPHEGDLVMKDCMHSIANRGRQIRATYFGQIVILVGCCEDYGILAL
jgi:hypothetical protein